MVDEGPLTFGSVKDRWWWWGWHSAPGSFLERNVFPSSREVSKEAGDIKEVKKAYERNRDKQAFIHSLLGAVGLA